MVYLVEHFLDVNVGVESGVKILGNLPQIGFAWNSLLNHSPFMDEELSKRTKTFPAGSVFGRGR
ncbi:MAG: hypothetical protein ACMUIL_07735 [bacterium]